MLYDDCQGNRFQEECQQLVNSVTDFKLYTFQSLRLATSARLSSPLSVTVHRGACNHSCEGGSLQACYTDKEHFTWLNVSSPFVLENHTFIKPHLFYCITAKISGNDCCPVCTDTSFMEDVNKPHISSVFDGSHWNVVILVSIFILLLGVGILLTRVHRKARTSGRPKISGSFENVPLSNCRHNKVEASRSTTQTTVVCLYIKEESQTFSDTINALQSSLRERGLNVIDMYEEEENILTSIQWTQNVLDNPEIKILLVDTAAMRQLWRRDPQSRTVCRATDYTIMYMMECVRTHMYKKWFVVRFQEDNVDVSENITHITPGKIYIFPFQAGQLAGDIMTAR